MTIKRGNRLFMKYEKWKKPNHKNENNAMKHMHCTISHHTPLRNGLWWCSLHCCLDSFEIYDFHFIFHHSTLNS